MARTRGEVTIEQRGLLVASHCGGVPPPHASCAQPASQRALARCLARYSCRRRGLSNHGGRSLRLGPRETVPPSESAGPCAVQAPVVNGAATSMGSSSCGTRCMVFLARLSDTDRRQSIIEPGTMDGPFTVLYVHAMEADA